MVKKKSLHPQSHLSTHPLDTLGEVFLGSQVMIGDAQNRLQFERFDIGWQLVEFIIT